MCTTIIKRTHCHTTHNRRTHDAHTHIVWKICCFFSVSGWNKKEKRICITNGKCRLLLEYKFGSGPESLHKSKSIRQINPNSNSSRQNNIIILNTDDAIQNEPGYIHGNILTFLCLIHSNNSPSLFSIFGIETFEIISEISAKTI